MNSTLKTTWMVIGAIVVIWAIYALVTRNNSNSMVDGDKNASTTVQADRSTGLPQQNNSNNTTATPGTASNGLISETALSMMIGNSLVRVPQTGVDVALTNGSSRYTNGSVKGTVTVGKILGRITTDEGTDVLAEMTLTKDGSSATFKYVALFHNVGENVKHTSSVLIGDRITISTITVAADKSASVNPAKTYLASAAYDLTVTYMDRKNGEPLTATPTVTKTLTVHVKSHVLATN